MLAEREQIHQQATQKAIEATALTKEWVIATLIENVERAMAKKEVHDGDGQLVGYRYEGNVANRALELLGKALGMFIDRKQVTGKDGGPSKLPPPMQSSLEGSPRSSHARA